MDYDEVWENERTPTPVRLFGVRLHSMGLSLREVVAVFEWLGIDRSHGRFGTGRIRSRKPNLTLRRRSRRGSRSNEKQIEVDGEKKWLYAAIDTDTKLLFEIDVFSRRGVSPAAAFLHRLTEKHEVSDAEFLTDAGGYLTALARLDLDGGLNYSERNYIEKWFQTVVMRIDRFHSFW